MSAVRARSVAAALVLAFLALGCARTDAPQARRPHVLTVARLNDPATLQPLFAVAQADVDLSLLYCETLVGLDARNELRPLLAARVPSRQNGGISRDGMRIVYHLRRDARFADGVPFTSRDVAFTYRAILDPANPVSDAEPYRQIARLDTPDAYTVVVHLRRPWAAAVSELFAQSDFAFGILPAHAFHSTALARGDWEQHAFGTGPFRVTRWKRGESVELARNPYAWRAPKLERLTIRIAADTISRFTLVQTHAVDISDVTDEEDARARNIAGYTVVRVPNNGEQWIEFQHRRVPTNDLRVREALVRAIDREAIRRTVFFGLRRIANTEIPSVSWGNEPGLEPQRYDVRAAAELLERAGWHATGATRTKNGRPLELTLAYISKQSSDVRIATLVQAQLRAVGVHLVLRGYPKTIFYAPAAQGGVAFSGRFDLSLTGQYGGADPEASEAFRCGQIPPAGSNTAFFCDSAYDAAFERQRRTLDRNERRLSFTAMQRILRDKSAIVPLAQYVTAVAVSSAVVGFAPNMLFENSGADEWDAR